MRLFLSGPITGIDNYWDSFNEAQKRLLAAGYYDTVNPAALGRVLPQGAHGEYMRVCMTLIDMCDAVVQLPGWEASRGCMMEYGYALGTDKTVVQIDDLLGGGEAER